MSVLNIQSISNYEPEILIYGIIESNAGSDNEAAADEISKELQAYKGKPITVRINSPGGDFFGGAAIYTALKEHDGKVTVKIDGQAASAASLIAMSGDEIIISPVGTLMIHKASLLAYANADEMKSAIDVLQKIDDIMANAYSLRSGKEREEILELMAKETRFTAQEAVDEGFADSIMDFEPEQRSVVKAVAYSSVKAGIERLNNKTNVLLEQQKRQEILEENKKILQKYGGIN